MKNLIVITSIILLMFSSCSEGYIPIQQTTPTGPISYQAQINPVVSSTCISCHSTSNPQGGLLLENYNQVRSATENGTLIQRINDVANPMPPSGLMPASTRALFDGWVTNNYLEN
jgi:cytochrome c5